MNSQMKKHVEQGPEGTLCRSFCPHGVGVHHPPQHMDVFVHQRGSSLNPILLVL